MTGRRFNMAAMVALQPPRGAVFHQPGGAIRAAQPMATGAAKREWRIAAPVQEQHGLFAALERFSHGGHQSGTQEAPARRAFAPKVNQANLRQHRATVPRRQMAFSVAPGTGIGERFKRGCGANQNARRIRQARPHHGHIARVIDHAFFLFEGGFMFFIHHNQAKIGKRQKQRRTRADQHCCATFSHGAPGNAPRAGRKL